jgi:hypothetical protein
VDTLRRFFRWLRSCRRPWSHDLNFFTFLHFLSFTQKYGLVQLVFLRLNSFETYRIQRQRTEIQQSAVHQSASTFAGGGEASPRPSERQALLSGPLGKYFHMHANHAIE